MANPYRDRIGRFASGGSGGKGKAANYAGMDYKGKEGKSFVVSDGTRTKYLNNKEFGDFSRQKLGFTGGKSSGTVTVRIPKAKKNPEAEAAQLKRDRQQVKMSTSTINKIYPKDGSRGGTPAQNKIERDRQAASVKSLRQQFAKRAKALPPELAASARLSKPKPSAGAMAIAKGLTRQSRPKKPKSRSKKPKS